MNIPEYVLIQEGQQYFYARGYVFKNGTFDKYKIMASVTEKEGREIVRAGNANSTWNDKGPIEGPIDD